MHTKSCSKRVETRESESNRHGLEENKKNLKVRGL